MQSALVLNGPPFSAALLICSLPARIYVQPARPFSVAGWSALYYSSPARHSRRLHTESGYGLQTGLWPTAVFPTGSAGRIWVNFLGFDQLLAYLNQFK